MRTANHTPEMEAVGGSPFESGQGRTEWQLLR